MIKKTEMSQLNIFHSKLNSPYLHQNETTFNSKQNSTLKTQQQK